MTTATAPPTPFELLAARPRAMAVGGALAIAFSAVLVRLVTHVRHLR